MHMHDCCPCLVYVIGLGAASRGCDAKPSGHADLPCQSCLCCQCLRQMTAMWAGI